LEKIAAKAAANRLKKVIPKLLGKITVLKNLIVSKLVFILSPLPTNCRVLKELSKSFFHFLWSGKGDKIKPRNVMIDDYSDGGLKMIDLESFNKALKSTCYLVGLPSLEATSNRTTCQNTVFRISSLWKSCKSGQK